MAAIIYDTPDGWKIREGTDVGLVSPTEALLLEIYNAITNLISEGSGKATLRNAEIPITIGATDSIVLDAYAGKIPVGLLGKKTSDGLFEVINPTNTPSYAITAADYNDQVLLANFQGVNTSTPAEYNFQQALTGVGTSIAWATGEYTQVVIYYINQSATINIQGMIEFTTVALQDAYTDSGLSAISNIAFVLYGQGILAPDQYSVVGTTITIAPGLPVEAGLKLLIVPFA